jgi:hypothetical protein
MLPMLRRSAGGLLRRSAGVAAAAEGVLAKDAAGTFISGTSISALRASAVPGLRMMAAAAQTDGSKKAKAMFCFQVGAAPACRELRDPPLFAPLFAALFGAPGGALRPVAPRLRQHQAAERRLPAQNLCPRPQCEQTAHNTGCTTEGICGACLGGGVQAFLFASHLVSLLLPLAAPRPQ